MPRPAPKAAKPRKPPDRATLRRALKKLQRYLERHPTDVRSMVRVARAHRLLGDKERSARWYKLAVQELANRGMGLRALALAKELLAVAPDDHELLLEMARLYARNPGAQREFTGRVAVPLDGGEAVVGPPAPEFTATSIRALEVLDDPEAVEHYGASEPSPATPPPPPPEAFTAEEAQADDRVFERVEKVTSGEHEAPQDLRAKKGVLERATLGEIPLLSGLGKGAFAQLMREMRRVDLEAGDVLFREGEAARSFFIIAEGRLSASVEGEEVAQLGAGEVIGVLGLYAGRRRNATVRAATSAVVFEITDQILASLAKAYPASRRALANFYRSRLLETWFGGSPLFRELPREARLSIIGRFCQRKLETNAEIVSPGEVVNGLFLVVRGEVVLSQRRGGRSEVLARIPRGAFFGCIAAMRGRPTMTSAACAEETVVATLPHKAFAEVLKAHPELRALPQKLAAEELLVTPTFFVGDANIPALSSR
ncbi:MAG: hypothetical protein D6729_18135 [Deltaproteobacteria bacterium]|nr:MAG: hypothetical protein D6729_18135 [Deltaproteobacteria bacterium]